MWRISSLLLCALLVARVAHAREVSVETDTLRMTVDSHILKMTHKASGLNVVANPKERDLFILQFLKKDGSILSVPGSQAKQTSIHVRKTLRGPSAMTNFAGFDIGGLSARVTAVFSRADHMTHWTIRVTNNTGMRLAKVRFPIVMAAPGFGDTMDDFIVLPALPGVLIENPQKNWKNNYAVTLKYPGSMSSQFISWQDRKAGIYMQAMDPRSHPMALTIKKQPAGYRLSHEFILRTDAPKEWNSPYPVAIGVTQGTWRHTADIYKRWAVKQSWCAKTLDQRDDIPDWWKKGPDVHLCSARARDPKTKQTIGSYYPKLRDHAKRYGKSIESDVVLLLAGWEKHRTWAAGDYFPIFDADNARKVLAELKQDGVRPFVYLSGLYYTLEYTGKNPLKIPAAEKYKDHYVIDQNTGKPKVLTLAKVRRSYQICPATPFAKTFFRNVIDQLREAGIDVVQMDQTVGGGMSACYSRKHGHVPGPGRYQTQAFHALLRDMREYGKSKTTDFVLFHEEPHEQLIPYLDGFHMREYKEQWWYRRKPGAWGIPLFCYLYHEYAIAYCPASLFPFNNPTTVREHAIDLVFGRVPGGSVWGRHERAFNAHPDQITMLRNHCRLLKTRARNFLMLGKMLHPCELDAPTRTFSFWRGNNAKPKYVKLDLPAILATSWQAPDGRIGHLFVNISDKPYKLAIDLDTRNAPRLAQCAASIYTSLNHKAGFQPLWKRASLPRPFTRNLAPLEAVFVELRKTK